MRVQNMDFFSEYAESSGSTYLATKESEKSYMKLFRYQSDGSIYLSYAMDEVAMTSDGFIMYAIDYLGVASPEMIVQFLRVLKRVGSELSIPSGVALKASVMARLRVMRDRGLVFRHSYEISGQTEEGGSRQCSLYTVTETAHQIIRHRLRKDGFTLNSALCFKPLPDLCDWAAASYVGCMMMESERFVTELDRVFRTKYGSIFLPCELKMRADRGEYFYLAIMNGNWYQDITSQTTYAYEDWVKNKLLDIERYLTYRTKTGVSVAVLVVRDMESLVHTCELINRSINLRPFLDRIVFTTEGVIRKASELDRLDKAFCYIRPEGESFVIEGIEKPLFI